MREIGSEFWDVPIGGENNYFPKSTQWFLSGRSALKAIIKELKSCHTVAVPSWCCDSMVKPFIDAGMEVNFYPIYWDKGLIQEINQNSDVLFLMDYFGYASTAPKLTGYKGIIIRDITHSIFASVYSDANYFFGSLRKWCGVWTGGFAWSRDGHELVMDQNDDFDFIPLRERAMQLKKRYIHGWGVTDKEFLKVFEEAECVLERVGIAPAAERDKWLAHRLDLREIRNRRRANAEILQKAFPDWTIFPEMKDTDCPMFVPILVPQGKRNELRQFLINNKIYCPIHWPVSKYHKLNKMTENIYQNELSLICDQRYNEEDMQRIIDIIKLFWKEG